MLAYYLILSIPVILAQNMQLESRQVNINVAQDLNTTGRFCISGNCLSSSDLVFLKQLRATVTAYNRSITADLTNLRANARNTTAAKLCVDSGCWYTFYLHSHGLVSGSEAAYSGIDMNGVRITSIQTRAWWLHVIGGSGSNRGQVLYGANFDTWSTASQATSFINTMTSYNTSNNLLLVVTYDEPTNNANPVRDFLRDRFEAKKAYPTVNRYAYALAYRHGYGLLGECSSAYQTSAGIITASTSTQRCGFGFDVFM